VCWTGICEIVIAADPRAAGFKGWALSPLPEYYVSQRQMPGRK